MYKVAIGSVLERVYPLASWQHCTFYRLSKLRATIGATDYRDVMVAEAACIFRCESFEAALDVTVSGVNAGGESASGWWSSFCYRLRDSLSLYELPKRWWKRVHTN